MILRQLLHADPVGISYLFGCGGKAVGAVVDPAGDVARYLDAARETGLQIRYVVDTHIHADHLSSGRALAAASGAEYVLFADAPAAGPFRAGAQRRSARPRQRVGRGAPHPRPHAGTYLPARDRPHARPGAVVRRHRPYPDGGRRRAHRACRERGRRRARAFSQSARLKALPDYLEVLPGALAGSVCGRGLSGNPMSTIGFERRNNAAFRIDDEEVVRRAHAERHSAAAAARGRVPRRQCGAHIRVTGGRGG